MGFGCGGPWELQFGDPWRPWRHWEESGSPPAAGLLNKFFPIQDDGNKVCFQFKHINGPEGFGNVGQEVGVFNV